MTEEVAEVSTEQAVIAALGQGRWADLSTLYLTGLKDQRVSAEQITSCSFKVL